MSINVSLSECGRKVSYHCMPFLYIWNNNTFCNLDVLKGTVFCSFKCTYTQYLYNYSCPYKYVPWHSYSNLSITTNSGYITMHCMFCDILQSYTWMWQDSQLSLHAIPCILKTIINFCNLDVDVKLRATVCFVCLFSWCSVDVKLFWINLFLYTLYLFKLTFSLKSWYLKTTLTLKKDLPFIYHLNICKPNNSILIAMQIWPLTIIL